MTSLEVLSAPTCDQCGGRTRFVGLESHSIDPQADVCTYECIVCQHAQAVSVVRVNGQANSPTPTVP